MPKEDRNAYLHRLADERGIPFYVVAMLAEMNGPNEDYDGLITALDDWEEMADMALEEA